MADRIGVARKWWQSPDKTSGSHYDIALSKKTLAVAAGAQLITLRQCGAMNTRRRVTGELGSPETAMEWVRAHMADRRLAKPKADLQADDSTGRAIQDGPACPLPESVEKLFAELTTALDEFACP